ncbi:MAG TPA: HU family DNA-binding protein [Gammaproteobacteria bacterium]|nr:HU family DNA-binding protein [Gammaproteobacteria bacterium]
MTRDDLIRALVDKQGHISYKVMCDAVKHLTETMVHSLSSGYRIEVRGFGSFALRSRSPRLARNPKTGAIVQTTQKYSVHFKPGKELKERVNAFSEVN